MTRMKKLLPFLLLLITSCAMQKHNERIIKRFKYHTITNNYKIIDINSIQILPYGYPGDSSLWWLH